MKKLFAALSLGLVAGGALAEGAEDWPAEALAGLMRVTYATTAKTECPGARVNDRRVQDGMVKVMTTLAGAGIDPVAAVKYLETEAGKRMLADQEKAFRARHGVAETGAEALCAAIRAELAADRDLARMVTLK